MHRYRTTILAACAFVIGALYEAFPRLAIPVLSAAALLGNAAAQDAGDKAKFPLPLPSKIGIEEFEMKLTDFILADGYKKWNHDNEVRATGPYIITASGSVESFGTHGPGGVKVYYSPEVWNWMTAGMKGDIPDGAMVLKEIYPRDENNPEEFVKDVDAFSIMVKDSKGSWDGWFWSDGGPLKKPKPEDAQCFFDANAGFGLACLNCHATVNNKESTYSNPHHVTARANPFINIVPTMKPAKLATGASIHDAGCNPDQKPDAWRVPVDKTRKDPFGFSDKMPDGANSVPEPYPFVSHDHVVQGPKPDGQKQFLTATACSGCHDATQTFSTLPNMAYAIEGKNGQQRLINLSQFGEWRYSMMGLSGRDPVFLAQLETERTQHPEIAKEVDNLCLSCHGVMGQRQLALDKPNSLFTHDLLYATAEHDPQNKEYGALARDGVSCSVCHRIAPDGLGTEKTYSGKFKLGKPNEAFGPYEKVVNLPMEQAIGVTPKLGAHIRNSNLCGSCHVVVTPSFEAKKKYTASDMGEKMPSSFHEQTTYFEWQNSAFSDEVNAANPNKKSCQDCHMPRSFDGKALKYKIANIEDNTFPYDESRLPDDKVKMAIRGADPKEVYSRHSLHGINAFVPEMFNQFPWLLGMQRKDNLFPADSAESGPERAVKNAIQLATKETANVSIAELKRNGNTLSAAVKVENLSGHKFPTGVAFRRAFIDLKVESGGKTIWESGATDNWGVLGVNADGKFTPLTTEFFEQNKFQPHHQKIEREDHVQIYEELVADADKKITTGFLSLREVLKDNRLLPRGWKKDGPEAERTRPAGEAKDDADYNDGSGADTVRYEIPLNIPASQNVTVTATLYYQALPPYYLRDRIQLINQPASRNLYYFIHQLKLDDTAMKNWKLEIRSDSRSLP
jgi:hypothetical protein